jgi:hypothetical protein
MRSAKNKALENFGLKFPKPYLMFLERKLPRIWLGCRDRHWVSNKKILLRFT